MADHGIQKITLVREVGKLPAVHDISICLWYFSCHLFLELKLEGEIHTCAKLVQELCNTQRLKAWGLCGAEAAWCSSAQSWI